MEMEMELCYKRAGLGDLELLTATRLEALRAIHRLDGEADLSEHARRVRAYYERALGDESHVAYLALDGARVAGAGGVDFFRGMPGYHNPTGETAFLMNLYTHPAYRRRGIARRMLELLVAAARERGAAHITLDATEMGRPLYEGFGFVPMEGMMELPGG